MKRRFLGLHEADQSVADSISDGLFLVRVDRAQYRRQGQKPYYLLRFAVIEPKPVSGRLITSRVYCTPKALWKLSWFLRDLATTPTSSDEMRSTRKPWSDCVG